MKIPKEVSDAWSREMEKRMKELMASDLWPNTTMFFIAKLLVTDQEWAKYKVKINYKIDRRLLRKGYRSMLIGYLLYKLPFFKKLKNIIFIDKLLKLPYKLKPHWWLNMDGHKFFMNEGDASMRAILKDYEIIANRKIHENRYLEQWEKTWEPETTKIVKDLVKPGMTCLDIGASVGYFTLLFSRQVGPTGKVFSFEPTTNQISYIKKNIKKNGYEKIAKVFHMGAFDVHDEIGMPVHAPIKYKVKVGPVDDVLEAEGVSQVDFIKIDVDGVEPRVLKGLIRIIERSPNLKMMIEYYPKYIEQAGCSTQEFMDIINKYFTYVIIPGDYTDGCWNYLCTKK